MPKASPIQTAFSGGEFSPLIQGRVDSERYKTGLDVCLNYIPLLQGPVVRRPGTKYVADVKDPSKPPSLIPFQFSVSQSYMLEFGDLYVRFYSGEGQVITTSNSFKVSGVESQFVTFPFTGIRSNSYGFSGELVTGSSFVAAGSAVEIVSPYSQTHVANIKWAQNGDTLYLTHPNYPAYKLQRHTNTTWTLKQVLFRDGPYLPLNSYKTLGDSTRIRFQQQTSTGSGTYLTAPQVLCSSVINNGEGRCRVITNSAHGYQTGDSVFISGVVGTVGSSINNSTLTVPLMSWPIKVVDNLTFDCFNTAFSGSYTGSGIVFPALFAPNPQVPGFVDVGRNVRVIQSGYAYWGIITAVAAPNQATILLGENAFFTGTGFISTWQMGVWYNPNDPLAQYPSAACFHQNRLAFTGTPQFPQEVDFSRSGDYENFAATNSSLIVTDSHAMQFTLNSSENNSLVWLKSAAQGLLSGSFSSEWSMSPSNQAQSLTPTNFNAAQTSFFGSANVDPVQVGNATLHVQKLNRKVREMNYFFQVGTFRSTDLTELAEHITAPSITKLAVQKEPYPLVWATRSDGALLSMSYNRDDTTLKVGWARHFIGGQSDSGGTIPQVKSIGVISASSASFEQLWMTVGRFINGTSAVTIETMVDPWIDSKPQEDAYYFDCGATYDAPVPVTNITVAGSAVVTTTISHGFNNGSSVIFSNVVGLNKQTTDIDGNVSTSNFINGKTFVVASATPTTFYLQDFQGSFVSASSYSQYVLGGPFSLFANGYVRKLVTGISGLTWLKNETVSLLADGGAVNNVIVNSAGVITLSIPAAKVQIGYGYNSDGKLLRPEAGSADGSSIGKTRRPHRAAFMLHKVGDFKMGMEFTRLIPVQFPQSDQQQANTPLLLWSGIHRDGLEAAYDFEGQVCFRQSTGLPGMVQTATIMLEEFDV